MNSGRKLLLASFLLMQLPAMGESLCTSILDGNSNVDVQSVSFKKVSKKYGFFTDAPDELRMAYSVLYNNKMSLSVFNKIADQFPDLNLKVWIQVYKSHLEGIRKGLVKKQSDQEIMIATFKELNKEVSIVAESETHYILEYKIENKSDLEVLSALGMTAEIEPLIFAKGEGLPSNHFFRTPESEIQRLNDLVKQTTGFKVDFRYSFTNRNLFYDHQISADAARALINYDGKAPIVVKYSVDKSRFATFKIDSSNDPSNFHEIVEAGFTEIGGMKGRFKQLPDTADTVSYNVTVRSIEELKKLPRLFDLGFKGRISLPD